ncbi:juvenile hormone-binding protein-like [Plodia interpunctella]|uniref:juvenile hormone-binding protein-like n=1 Tax=Plodia interpunctella TaxID=58824 RepID=UPI00236778E9|nr:juvenile hormone-binding protein-like [Plodia interpunctella]
MSVYFVVIWCFVFLQTVLAALQLPEPCSVSDMGCLTKVTQVFLDNTSGGIPEHDIKPLDPITISSLDVTPEGVGVTFHFKNIVVNGFKDQKISYFKLNKDYKTVNLKTKVDLTLKSDVVVELHKPSKKLSGTVNAKANAEGNAEYTYNFVTDENGVEHYEVGPETNSCEVFGDPKFTVNPEIMSAIQNDADFQAEREKYLEVATKTRRKIICDVVKTVYITAIHNIRASARILPKSAYFKDV